MHDSHHTSADGHRGWKRYWGQVAPGFCGVSLVVVLVLTWAIAVYGTPRRAWLYASGVRLMVEGAPIRFGDARAGEDRDAAFLVSNLSDDPVQVLGVKTSCGCIAVEKLPVTVPPRGTKEVRLTIHLEESFSGTVEQALTFHTDEPSTPRFLVKVSGRVIGR